MTAGASPVTCLRPPPPQGGCAPRGLKITVLDRYSRERARLDEIKRRGRIKTICSFPSHYYHRPRLNEMKLVRVHICVCVCVFVSVCSDDRVFISSPRDC